MLVTVGIWLVKVNLKFPVPLASSETFKKTNTFTILPEVVEVLSN
jgi:hypothetical protein